MVKNSGTVRRRRQGRKVAQQVVAKRPLPRRVARPVAEKLDLAALQWRRLLEDPCNAPLVYPCYTSAGGGSVLMRVEFDQVMFATSTETCGIYALVPGIAAALINTTPLVGDGSTTALTGFPAPGAAWLTANTNAVRCVAACTQVMYPGSELTRSGVVGVGVVPASMLTPSVPTVNGGGGLLTTSAAFRTSCAHVERMPATLVEAKWFPGQTDQESSSPVLGTSFANELDGRNAIIVSLSGFPVSTGVRVRSVVVYEVNFLSVNSYSLGTVQSVAPPISVVTPAAVVKSLFDRDPEWWIGTALKAGRVLSNVVSYAAAGAKAAGRAVNGIAMIAA